MQQQQPHSVNPLGMQPMSMPMGVSMPMSMSSAPNAVSAGIPGGMQMGMGMNPMAGVNPQYGVGVGMGVPQQPMMMNMGAMNGMDVNSMAMKMNPMGMPAGAMNSSMNPAAMPAQPMATADWRIQVTREHRANLIAKIYNELVRVSTEPPPGIKLWMNVAWYELQLYKESRTQEDYISKIFSRLKTLRAQQTDASAAMHARTLPNNGQLSRLDFSYYNNHRVQPQPMVSGQPQPGYPVHPQFAGHPGAPNAHPKGAPGAMPGQMGGGPAGRTPGSAGSDGGDMKSQMAMPSNTDNAAEYWRQHAALKAKYHDDVEKVHSAFKKYVDHMKDQNETDQKKKLRYLLSYVQLCANVLSEDKTTHQPRKLEELDKVYKYIVKIVNPYLKKLRTETDKRTFGPNGGSSGAAASQAAASAAMSMMSNALGGPQQSSASQHQQQSQHKAQPGAPNSSGQQQLQNAQQNAQQKQQQQYQQQLHQHQLQQSAQQASQAQQQQQQQFAQQRMQMARQQQHMMQQQQQQQQQQQHQQQQQQQHQQQQHQQQQHQMLQQQQAQQKSAHGQPQSAQQGQDQQTQANRQQGKASTGQSQGPPESSQSLGQAQGQAQSQQRQQHAQQQQPPAAKSNEAAASQSSRGPNSPTLGSGIGLTLDDSSLYSGIDSSLLQMSNNLPTPATSSGFPMSFGSDLSPTTFSGSMDLSMLDMDGSGLSGLSYDSQENSSGSRGTSGGSAGGNGADGSGDGDLMNFVEAL